MTRLPVVLALVLAAPAVANPDGAPAAHTGGFGEPSCHACHFDGPLERASTGVRLSGLPATVVAGTTYELTLAFDADAPMTGFELSARDAAGAQAGTLTPCDDTTQLVRGNGVEYLTHTRAGLVSGGRWRFSWRAPARAGTVAFHAALNAANDDRSEFGDRIVLFEALSEMEERGDPQER